MNQRLENEKVSSLLFSLALPSILAQLATLIYNMVDRIYIGRLPDGGLSIAGIGLCTSIITIITAFSNLFGRGGAPLASIKLGEKNPKEAERILGNAFSSLILTSLIIMFCLFVWGDKILIIFGASQKTLPYALSYLRIYAVGTVFIQLFYQHSRLCKVWHDDFTYWWYFKYYFRSYLYLCFTYECCWCCPCNHYFTICLMYLGVIFFIW